MSRERLPLGDPRRLQELLMGAAPPSAPPPPADAPSLPPDARERLARALRPFIREIAERRDRLFCAALISLGTDRAAEVTRRVNEVRDNPSALQSVNAYPDDVREGGFKTAERVTEALAPVVAALVREARAITGEDVRWPLVDALAVEMRRKLEANKHKSGWKTLGALWCVRRMEQELRELRRTVENDQWRHVPGECADVANFGAMLLDNLRAGRYGNAAALNRTEARDE